MDHLINLTGSFNIDELKKIVSRTEFLANQPPLETHEIYAGKDPKLRYKKILVAADIEGLNYHVMDMGIVRNVPYTVTLGSKIYSKKDVEKLMQGN